MQRRPVTRGWTLHMERVSSRGSAAYEGGHTRRCCLSSDDLDHTGTHDTGRVDGGRFSTTLGGRA
jgi:hypothetical protein